MADVYLQHEVTPTWPRVDDDVAGQRMTIKFKELEWKFKECRSLDYAKKRYRRPPPTDDWIDDEPDRKRQRIDSTDGYTVNKTPTIIHTHGTTDKAEQFYSDLSADLETRPFARY